jgi:ABC-type amino acid transport substrate-binding protein
MVVLVLVGLVVSSWAPGGDLANSGQLKKTSPVLKKVLERGFLRCGVAPENSPGWREEVGGQLVGFDIDFCKAVAVAIFNDETRVEYVVPADWDGRFTLLKDGDADVVFGVATITAHRDSELLVDFPAAYYYEVTEFKGNTGVYVTDALGPVVAHGDQQWADIVRWVVYGMITAEELGVDSEYVLGLTEPPSDPRVAALLGSAGVGTRLGLGDDFMVNVIATVGNYAEVYARHSDGLLTRAGSLNELWTEGGLLYAPSRP